MSMEADSITLVQCSILDSSLDKAPINQLPPEILADIFALCLSDDRLASPTPLSAPILLVTISRRWRNITLSTPHLWTSFHLHLDSPDPLDMSKAHALVKVMDTWIGRSGSLPLSLGLYCSTFGRSVYSMRPLVKHLISFSPRCHDFTLHLGQMRRPSHVRPYQGYPWFRLPSQKSFPFLEKVDLDLPFRDALAFLQPAIESTPRLRDITLAGAPPSLLTVLPHTTLGQLTDLRTTSVESLQECCEILNLSPRLRNCRFDLDFQPHTTPPGLSSPIIHHDLDKLYVGPTDLGVFFNSITLPALRTLSINLKDSPQRGKWGQQSFIDFLGRSHCSLTKLSLYNINITAAHLIECLETVSRTLVELHIDRGQTKFITPMVVGALTFSELNSPLCPLLERIRIRGHIFDEEVSGAAMVRMVESRFRRDSSSRLRWACIGGCYDENDWKKIRDLQRVGLALTISEKDFNGSDPGLFDCIVF